MKGIGSEYSLVRIHENSILVVGIDTGLTVLHEIRIGILLEQVAHAHNAVAELVVEPGRVIHSIEKTDLVGTAAIKMQFLNRAFSGNRSYCSQSGSRHRALPILSASPSTP